MFLCHERRKGEGSRWAPWLSLLPPLDTNASVLTYPESQLTELQASPLLTTIRDARRRLTETHGRLLKLKGFRGRPPHGVFKKYLREEHVWGLLSVVSRAHKVRVKDGRGAWHDTSCLVPLADMFNTGGPRQLNTVSLPLNPALCHPLLTLASCLGTDRTARRTTTRRTTSASRRGSCKPARSCSRRTEGGRPSCATPR